MRLGWVSGAAVLGLAVVAAVPAQPAAAARPTLVYGGWRIFLHAWVCSGTTPCVPRADGSLPAGSRRVLYAAVLNWNGATPPVGAFL